MCLAAGEFMYSWISHILMQYDFDTWSSANHFT
jgi:hypothetical protein